MKILDVNLVMFEDDSSGEYGLCPKGTEDKNFNAFWNGIGIFHDVFEHWFEEKHKYFKGDYAFNICGEMCAMGAAFYYYEILGEYRSGRSIYSFYDAIMNENKYSIQEAIKDGNCFFGDELKCCIPYQKPTTHLDDYINNLVKEIKDFKISSEYPEYSLNYKKSATFQNISNPYRYGYKMAEKLISSSWRNTNTLVSFINFFNDFCKNNSAEKFSWGYSGINVKVFKEKGEVRIKAYAISHEGKRELLFNSNY